MAQSTKKLPDSTKRRPPAAGKGRPKGARNKTTTLLKDAILMAATEADKGGLVGYLKAQAKKHPGPFMTLLGKILPMQHTGAIGTFDLTNASDDDVRALETVLARIADAATGSRGTGEAGGDQAEA